MHRKAKTNYAILCAFGGLHPQQGIIDRGTKLMLCDVTIKAIKDSSYRQKNNYVCDAWRGHASLVALEFIRIIRTR